MQECANAIQPNLSDELSKSEKEFLHRIHQICEARFVDPSFDVRQLSQALGIGKTLLNRKMKALSGYAPGQYIHRMRMSAARHHLEHSHIPMKNIAWMCGFATYTGFWNSFRKEHEQSPTEYRNRYGTAEPTVTAQWTLQPDEEEMECILKAIQSSPWLLRLFEYVLDHIDEEELQLNHLSLEFRMGPAQLTRELKLTLGVTPMQLVRHLRLLVSRELLPDRSKSITEIAYESGFYDHSHFCRTYRSAFGSNPSTGRHSMERHPLLFRLRNAVLEQE